MTQTHTYKETRLIKNSVSYRTYLNMQKHYPEKILPTKKMVSAIFLQWQSFKLRNNLLPE